MELKINYQYTYFIYPYAIKQTKYKKYITNMLKNKRYKLELFDSFKDIDLYNYFLPSVRNSMFQDFTFTKEKINAFNKLSNSNKYRELLNQNCITFEYNLEEVMQGKIQEKDGIFFKILKIEIVCLKNGICFLLFKTHIEETDKFSDLLNFNYKFGNINLENKSLKKLEQIKIQTDAFSNIKKISEIITDITGKRVNSRNIDINDDMFLTYSYVCIDSENWNKDTDFENIKNEFIKLSNVLPSNTNVNVDYDKLTMITNSSFMRLRINNKGSFLICSSTDQNNYTKIPSIYERQYLYTYLISLGQRYYLKKLRKEFNNKKQNKKTLNKFINFTKDIWINEVTTEGLGQKIYKRCKEKMNLEELYYEVKVKYDTFYKNLKIEKNEKQNKVIIIMLIVAILLGISNLASWMFFK